MVDRIVQQIDPAPKLGEGPRMFSSFLAENNVVLLGDPGAGKSYLFEHFSVLNGASKVSAREFLTTDAEYFVNNDELFIDALDEKRAGRGDQDSIDSIITKLWKVKPKKMRIACRAQDWLGETDLAAFKRYFSTFGGHVVLHLEPLSIAEQIAFLKSKEIHDPHTFRDTAIDKGLKELLGNPQNLQMLVELVKTSSWPSNRYELFERSADIKPE
jgi:predicted NACHT family NTPase